MIYPRGVPVELNLRTSFSERVVDVASCRDQTLIAIITHRSLIVIQAQSNVILASLSRCNDDVETKGENENLIWRHDSASICVTTTKKMHLIYDVNIGESDEDQRYMLRDIDSALGRATPQLFRHDHKPNVALSLKVVVRMSMQAKSTLQYGDDLLVCVSDGWFQRISWKGEVKEDQALHLSSIPFTHTLDIQQSGRAEYVNNVHVVKCSYSPLVSMAVVLSNGRGALLQFSTVMKATGIWAQNLNDAVTLSTNHRFRIVAFACKNGDIAVYHIDEFHSTFIPIYRRSLHYPEIQNVASNLGAVHCLKWHPTGHVLVVSWQKHAQAIFSTFGSQLWRAYDESNADNSWKAIEWAADGHQLWFIDGRAKLNLLSVVRNAALMNPSMASQEDVCIYTADTVYIAPKRQLEKNAHAPHAVWRSVTPLHNYLGHAWPIRYCSLSADATKLVVAGTRGFAVFSLTQNKWSLFNNETQEREVIVIGGISLWRNHSVIAPVYDLHRQQYQLRAYPLGRQIQDDTAALHLLDAHPTMMCMRNDTVCLFDASKCVRIYTITKQQSPQEVDAPILDRVAEIRCDQLVPHPVCVVDLLLTNMQHYVNNAGSGASPASSGQFAQDADSLLINIAGKLVLLTAAQSTLKQEISINDKNRPQYELQTPLTVASCVEQMWHLNMDHFTSNNDQPHLRQALWLTVGWKGLRVWMPLTPAMSTGDGNVDTKKLNQSTDRSHFISKRIMLPFELESYPLLICALECVAIALDAEPTESRCRTLCVLQRRTELFLHHLLRQLLKRNLGLYALQIANTCRHLPYFSHVLELLLHQILEEEASSSEPIPDPLLPRVVTFIQEFPEYLHTIAHCARKTELALWSQLFACVGNPRDLFEICLRDGKLETAATYLIILQSMEMSDYSKQQGSRLLENVLHARQWHIARDICRFIRSIDPVDLHSPHAINTPALKQSMQHPMASKHPSAAIDDDTSAFIFPPHLPSMSSRQHQNSLVNAPPTSPKEMKFEHRTSRHSQDDASEEPNELQLHVMMILTKHARYLLQNCRLKDLGKMAAILDYHLVLWLRRERKRAARITDAVKALTQLHQDFKWPYPLLSTAVVESLTRRLQSSANLRQFDGDSGSSMTSTSERAHSPNKPKPPRPTALTVITGNDYRNMSADSGFEQQSIASGDNMQETVRLLVKQQTQLSAQRVHRHYEHSSRSDDTVVQQRSEVTLERQVDHQQQSTSIPAESDTQSTFDEDYDWMYPHYAPSTKENVKEPVKNSTPTNPAQQQQNVANVQLRYLQQIMLEAECTEWSLLLCVILRDMVGLSRALRSVDGTTKEEEADRRRLIAIVRQLRSWAESKCTGYTPLLNTIYHHLLKINKHAHAKPSNIGELNSGQQKRLTGAVDASTHNLCKESLALSMSAQDLPAMSARPMSPGSISVDVVERQTAPDDSNCVIM